MKMKYLFLLLGLTACASANRGSIDDATILKEWSDHAILVGGIVLDFA